MSAYMCVSSMQEAWEDGPTGPGMIGGRIDAGSALHWEYRPTGPCATEGYPRDGLATDAHVTFAIAPTVARRSRVSVQPWFIL